MAEQNEIEHILSDPMYCHQLYSQAMAQNPPPKKYRNYDYERQNMMKDKTWYALGNPNYPPQFKLLSQHYNVPVDCLKKWREKLKQNINWVPDQGHGEQQRMRYLEKQGM